MMIMVQATDDDAMTADNVRPIRPDVTPEPQPRRERRKDHRAAARKAKSRSKNNIHRDASVAKDALVYALPIAPTVTQTARNGVMPSRETSGSRGWREPMHVRQGAAIDLAAYTAAVALAGAAAWFSVRGMVVIFPGTPTAVVAMAIAMEAAKLITAGWLARRGRATAVVWRAALAAFVFGLAVINAAGVYAQLVASHVGDRGAATSHLETQTAEIEAKISVQAHTVRRPRPAACPDRCGR